VIDHIFGVLFDEANLGQSPETSIPFDELADGFDQILFAELRPSFGSDPNLGVADLP
jgi:hypothetical protein